MKSRLSSTTIFDLKVILAIAICFPAHWCQKTRLYDICNEPLRCGDIDIEYPFWGLSRPKYCGHPGFELTCQSNVTEFVFRSVNYRVLDTNSSTNTVTIARNDMWSSVCPSYLHNTTYDSTLFNSGSFDQENVSVYYGCQDNNQGGMRLRANYRFICDTNLTESGSFFGRTSLITPLVGNLSMKRDNHIMVPVDRSWAYQLASDTASVSELRSALMEGFKLEWMANNEDCDRCVRSGGRCGSNSTSPDVFACYCANGNDSQTCQNAKEKGGYRKIVLKIVVGISGGFAGIMFILIMIYCLKLRFHVTPKEPEATSDQIEIFIRNYGSLAPKRYKYSEIKKMTNSFLDKLGKGGYGSVYKGQLPDGHVVAVKLLSETRGDGEDFINEVASISRTSHVNIVTLLGFCIEGKKRALMYEFMPNGSLDKFLRGDGLHLDWNALFQIAKGIARGLEYLHRGCNTRIVHFDIKPHNILLDEEFVPKISDFGLAKLCKRKESIVSVMGTRGTAGYMAPEVFFRSLGGASHKSDVYSYGMMVLEMTGAHKNNNSNNTSEAFFPDWIYKQVEAGSDLKDYGVSTEGEVELARRMMMVGLWCIQYNPSDRPSISKVVEMLEGSFESLNVPPRCFWPSSPSRSAQSVSQLDTLSSISERRVTD